MENIIDPAYAQWINQLKNEYRQTQIKAAIRVNEQLIRFYYRLGEEITKRGYESTYGSAFYEKLSADIRKEIPDAKGFSSTNLHYMSAFYRRYSPLLEVLLQAAKSSESAIVPTFQRISYKLQENLTVFLLAKRRQGISCRSQENCSPFLGGIIRSS